MSKRNPMKLECPECGSAQVRPSKLRHFGEKLVDFLGFPPMRCADCEHRWTESLWRLGESFYARCPKCFRLELGAWEETYYHIPGSWKLACSLGAKKVRCRPCRHNFISFRLVRGNKKWVNEDPLEADVAETTISLAEMAKASPRAAAPEAAKEKSLNA